MASNSNTDPWMKVIYQSLHLGVRDEELCALCKRSAGGNDGDAPPAKMARHGAHHDGFSIQQVAGIGPVTNVSKGGVSGPDMDALSANGPGKILQCFNHVHKD